MGTDIIGQMNDPPAAGRQEIFDRWAKTYDLEVPSSSEFPLAGYGEVLAKLCSLAEVEPEMLVLDIGTGTGNLAGCLSAQARSIWATDFSEEMIKRAREKYPSIDFAFADLQDDLPSSFPKQYHRIVSAYALHHLDLDGKARLIQNLAFHHLLPGGRILIADVAFRTNQERAAARSQFASRWDSDEFYWSADETKERLGQLPLAIRYAQVSFCGGIFVIEPSREPTADGQ